MAEEKIYIDNSLTEWDENKYARSLKIQMPKNSQFVGYHFFISQYYAKKNPITSIILKGEADYTFTLIKTEREEGKRYSRPRLTWEELREEFVSMHDKFVKKALAYVYDYDFKGQFETNRTGLFVLGGLDEKWLYVSDEDRRRLSAKNFKLIRGNLTPGEVSHIEALFKELHTEKEKIFSLGFFNGDIDNFKHHFLWESKERGLENRCSFLKTCPELKGKAQEFYDLLVGALKNSEKRVEEIENELFNF